MAVTITLKKSSVANKRPFASTLVPGELALNANSLSPGIFFLDSADNVVKVGPAAVGPSAPNVAPVGSTGNSVGEIWYDTSTSQFKIWTGFAWGSNVLNITGTSPISVNNADPINPIVTTSMATNRLLGRSTAGTGVAEQISLGTYVQLNSGVLNVPGSTASSMTPISTTATADIGATVITVPSTTGIGTGDYVFGFGIIPGTTVVSGTATTLTLSQAIVSDLSSQTLLFSTGGELLPGGLAYGGLVKASVYMPNNVTVNTTPFGASPLANRTSGSTTLTVTTQTAHGLLTGHVVFTGATVPAGVVGSSFYTVTSVPTSTTFTFVSGASTVLTNAAITFSTITPKSAYNIHSIPGNDYSSINFRVNFATPIDNYTPMFNAITTGNGSPVANISPTQQTTVKAQASFYNASGTSQITSGVSAIFV